MANRYNDQDYPHYYEHDDRYNSRTEHRTPGRERSPDYYRNRDEENRHRAGSKRDVGPQQGYSGRNFDSDYGREHGSHEGNRSDYQNPPGSSRRERDEQGDYTLYGYDRNTPYGNTISERDRGNAGRGGDYGFGGSRNYGQDQTSDYERSSSSEFRRSREDYGRGSGNERSSNSRGQNESFYGQGGNYVGSESGWSDERAARGNQNQDDRGWWDKTTDAVSSWFGDEEAAKRRRTEERGHSQGQSHRGRGPRNYRRSDERIKEDINDRLTDYPYLDASDIEAEVSNGEVTLTGTVESRYAKRMAEDIAEDISGVKHVENRLRVAGNQTGSSNWGSSTGSSGDYSNSGTSAGSLMNGSRAENLTADSAGSTGISGAEPSTDAAKDASNTSPDEGSSKMSKSA